MHINLSAITVEKILFPLFIKKNIEASVLRLDKIHPLVSGNKWFKLQYYLEEAKNTSKKYLATYGGNWSNHILATAAAAKMNNLGSIGIIRGEELKNTEMLMDAEKLGMQFIFLSRKHFKEKIIPDELPADTLLIPEGGSGEPGIRGASTILDYCDKNLFTHFICATGTGTMAEGLKRNLNQDQLLISIPVIKGYGKYTSPLLQFMNEFYSNTAIPTDFIYTGKMFYKAMELVNNDHFTPGSSLLFIHSGGLQGNRSLPKGSLMF